MALAWIAVALLFAVVEVATVSLFAAFLAVGALGAAVVAFVGQGLIPQALAFVIVAGLGVVLARPYLMRHLRRNASVETVSGAQAMIGETAVVVHRLNGAPAADPARSARVAEGRRAGGVHRRAPARLCDGPSTRARELQAP